MANRLPSIAAFFLSVFLLSGLTDARAADPGFCRQYAEAALGQVFETVAFDYELPDAIHDGWLVPITQRAVHVGATPPA